MGLSLSNMTGLALHWSIKKTKEDEIDFDNLSEGTITDDDDDFDEASNNCDDSIEEEDEEEEEENPNLEFEVAKRKNNFTGSSANNAHSKHQKIDDFRPGTSTSKNNDSGRACNSTL